MSLVTLVSGGHALVSETKERRVLLEARGRLFTLLGRRLWTERTRGEAMAGKWVMPDKDSMQNGMSAVD